jgi:hypothetical protein
MSNDEDDLESQLTAIIEQHRVQHIEDELDDIAETMEETILQRAVAKSFFDKDIEIDAEAREHVMAVQEKLADNQYDAVEAELPELEVKVRDAETTVGNQIQELRLGHSSTVEAMQRLNNRVDRVNETRLNALSKLLNDWRWRDNVYLTGDANMDQLIENANQYGKEMREAFEELKEELFGHYPSNIRDLVHRMIDDERLTYADLTPTQRQQLADSDLNEFIELTLS